MNHAHRIRIEEPHGERKVQGVGEECGWSRLYLAGDESGWHTEYEMRDYVLRQERGRAKTREAK